MFTGIDRIYFEQPVRILVLILNLNRGSSLYLKHQSRGKFVFAVIIIQSVFNKVLVIEITPHIYTNIFVIKLILTLIVNPIKSDENCHAC